MTYRWDEEEETKVDIEKYRNRRNNRNTKRDSQINSIVVVDETIRQKQRSKK